MTEVYNTQLLILKHEKCGWEGIPVLERVSDINNPGAFQLGAYCPSCKGWIKWVPQTKLWTQLWDQQSVHLVVTTQEEQWVAALTEMAVFCFAQSGELGFHDRGRRDPLQLSMLIITELSELCEAYRNGTGNLPSEHIPEYTQFEEEWADVLVRAFDHSVEMGVDSEHLARAFVAKLAFNRTRGYRHGGKAI